MPRSGGVFTPPTSSWSPAVNGQNATVADWNNLLTDISSALSASVSSDGQTSPTANLPMGGFRHTNVANAVNRNEYAGLGQIQDGGAVLLTSVSGTNTITGSLTPAIPAYVTGQTFRFIAAGTNTGAVTLNVNGLGAKNITKSGSTALSAGDITSGSAVQVIYDGTQFQLTSGAGGGAVAGGVLFENSTTLSTNYTLSTGKNAMMVGPLSVATGITLTVPTGARLVVL